MAKISRKKIKEFLKGVRILSRLTDMELESILDIVKEIEIPVQRVIIKEGDIGDSMYLFAEGQVNVTKNLTLKLGKAGFSRAEKSMVHLDSKKVSFFGDMAMFDDAPRSATITASAKCLLYEIKRKDFEEVCLSNPELGFKILREIVAVLCTRIRKGNQDVLKLSTALSIALSQ
ncbi:MAG: cyclic nucleotide-binding domain-containing protein [Candidatus Pacearchaeota archaeon]|nr:cyclic nucleotide-binding domain-containing protein [Candidatus Pacearchaeota archaeon]